MFKRTLSDKLASLAQQFPVVSITGPRQSGKTTLSKAIFSGHAYISLEDPNEREFAVTDPKGFLRRFSVKGHGYFPPPGPELFSTSSFSG
jgi:predicted AAA+ superfamily ATPase